MSISGYIKNIVLLGLISSLIACEQKISLEPTTTRRVSSDNIEEVAGRAFLSALKSAHGNEEEGFLSLYRISRNPDIYTVEYQEAANDALTELLYTKTELWIKVFAPISDFRFSFGVLPEEIPETEYDRVILNKLNKIHPDSNEEKLIRYIKSKL